MNVKLTYDIYDNATHLELEDFSKRYIEPTLTEIDRMTAEQIFYDSLESQILHDFNLGCWGK